ncbi:nicotinate phosphoribosyltransferase, partial [Mycobacterium tuberculosis]
DQPRGGLVTRRGRPRVIVRRNRVLRRPLFRAGKPVAGTSLAAARKLVASGLRSLPADGLKLAPGEPAIPTRTIPA